MSYDLVIRGGTVLDGTGTEGFTADIAVRDGKIETIGKVDARGSEEIEAEGAIVTPGFVDIHTHYDGLSTWANRMNPSSHHGVTTVVMGNCGVGFAPVRETDHGMLIELMEGVEDIPGVALHEGLPWAWESFPDYLDFLESRHFDMDIATQLPHAALRVYVMGDRGARREEATPEDIAEMKRLTHEAMKAGALGFSSSRTLNHRSINGDPTPSLTAAQAELIGIAEGVKEAGTGAVLEMISDFDGFETEFEILMSMVDAGQAPMTISLLQVGQNPDGWRRLLGAIDKANNEGRTVKGQVAPRAVGLLLGLSTNRPALGTSSATLRSIMKLPMHEKLERMRDASFRQRVLEEAADMPETFFHYLWPMESNWDYEPSPQDSIASRARAKGVSSQELAYDLMMANDGEQLMYRTFANYQHGNLDICREMLLAENTVPGLGDGGAHVGIISDASFVTFLLTHWGRDRKRGSLIDLPTLVKRQTQDTARAVRLYDRGLLKAGMKADINVIDYDNLRLTHPYTVHDLPSGAPRLEQKATGYLATVVNGAVTYRNGEATDALSGRLIRGPQPLAVGQ